MQTIIFTLVFVMITITSTLRINASDKKSVESKVDIAALKTEAIGIVKQFGGTLKPLLQSTMKESGPVEAIKVCSNNAPLIAEQLSKDTAWNVKRVSLKTRNAQTATPDEWETKILEQFDQRQAKGESAKKMAYAEIVEGQFRFMKAQGVEPVCLKCHGDAIAPKVDRALRLFYSGDRARGYLPGQIRGAISLRKPL
ncbi:MAG: DUF3365 domain-containing protein [Planctomycetes bacterium]|nr:DUF3365 domain-containing protein [Planctomycetota bacterium]